MAISRSTAPDVVRERLAPPALIVGLALGIVLALALLFDPRSFLQRIRHSHAASVDLYFVQELARIIHTRGVTLLLARREIETGHNVAALRLLAPMLATTTKPGFQEQVRWLYYRNLLAVNDRSPQGSPARARNEHALRLLISQLRAGANEHALYRLAHEATLVHDEGTAIRIYRDLARRNGAHRSKLYALAAAAADGLHHPREAARLDFAAQASASTRAAATRYFLAALRVLQSHNQPLLALREGGRHLGLLADEAAVLRRLVILALAADKPKIAAHYARRLLIM